MRSRVAVHLGLAQHAAQQLLGLVEVAHADQHRRVQQLERARALLGRGLAGELLGAHAQAAGDLHQHARAGAAVAGLDPGQVAVRAAVEREVALGHPALAAQVADARAELAQRLVRVLAVVTLGASILDLPSLESVHSWQSYCTGRGAASADYTLAHAVSDHPPAPAAAYVRHPRGCCARRALSPADLIQPLFVRHGGGPIGRDRVDARPAPPRHRRPGRGGRRTCRRRACPAVLLFGLPARKDEAGSEAYDPEGHRAARASARSRRSCPTLIVITDVCLCEYTSHGHCGVIQRRRRSTTT